MPTFNYRPSSQQATLAALNTAPVLAWVEDRGFLTDRFRNLNPSTIDIKIIRDFPNTFLPDGTLAPDSYALREVVQSVEHTP